MFFCSPTAEQCKNNSRSAWASGIVCRPFGTEPCHSDGRANLLFKGMWNFSCEDEVVFVQAIYFVCPYLNFCFAPSEIYVGMMALFFGDLAYFVDECKCFDEILKFKRSDKFFIVYNFPAIRQLL